MPRQPTSARKNVGPGKSVFLYHRRCHPVNASPGIAVPGCRGPLRPEQTGTPASTDSAGPDRRIDDDRASTSGQGEPISGSCPGSGDGAHEHDHARGHHDSSSGDLAVCGRRFRFDEGEHGGSAGHRSRHRAADRPRGPREGNIGPGRDPRVGAPVRSRRGRGDSGVSAGGRGDPLSGRIRGSGSGGRAAPGWKVRPTLMIGLGQARQPDRRGRIGRSQPLDSMKFLSRRMPSWVRKLSGWNWTPSIG